MEGKAAEELPSAAETPSIPAAPIVAPRLIRDEGVAYLEQVLGERFYERVEVRFDPSVIHLGSIDRVDLYPGGYPARFGRLVGGVVSAQTRGPEPALSGEANPRLFDVGGLIETPFARGRGSLLPALLSLLSPEVKLDTATIRRGPPMNRAHGIASACSASAPTICWARRGTGILRWLGDACRPKITFTW